MGQLVDDTELRRRAIAGVRDEVEAFGSARADSRLIRRQGLLASVVPASPQRSLFNSVFYDDPVVLAREMEALKGLYDSHGIDAWTVWVPDEDRETARLLAARGHLLDAAPRAMAMELSELAAGPPAPDGVEPGPISPAAAAELNDRAYGYGEDGFRAGLAGETAIRWHGAYEDGRPVCCVGTIEVGEDCCITGVATPSEHRGCGIASWLMLRALAEAREEGLRTASLQATKAGAPIYERLGFADFGFIEMWELRR
ncbi:MAG TPA: GNAT family N-acetyltransferase [Solirubrobacterales bacterium]|nr:GNAT family N-acetyltransferase [Solirubrobacterales bacterium]